MPDANLKQLIKEAIDMHVHIGPELIPRKYSASSLARSERGKLGGAVVKSHFYPTVFATAAIRERGFTLIPGLVLNNFVGGLNPEAVYATSLLADGPFVVWLPTISAEQFLRQSEYEVAPEWAGAKGIAARPSDAVVPARVSSNGTLTPAATRVIAAIARTGAVLATGHISPYETELVADYARRCGVRAVIVTHPIYQRINMPLDVQKKLAAAGCYIEQSYSMYSIDGISMQEIAIQIKEVGADSVILSSDVGQRFSASPGEALLQFASLLMREGITIAELERMLVVNPRKILGD